MWRGFCSHLSMLKLIAQQYWCSICRRQRHYPPIDFSTKPTTSCLTTEHGQFFHQLYACDTRNSEPLQFRFSNSIFLVAGIVRRRSSVYIIYNICETKYWLSTPIYLWNCGPTPMMDGTNAGANKLNYTYIIYISSPLLSTMCCN